LAYRFEAVAGVVLRILSHILGKPAIEVGELFVRPLAK
jgi:hypothetical protein